MEYLIPLIIGVTLSFLLARWAYRKESTKSRKITGAILFSLFGFFVPFIISAFVMSPPQQEKTQEELVMARLSNSVDGCPLDLKKRVKEAMNEPASFSCIETNVIQRKDDYVLMMQFRGKNQFGSMVKQVSKAEYDSDGKFVQFIK
ncbi:hypothetical protein [Buttiauxella izardii]|uniref:Uncharacterized protein n=1 Tax=Buttiauxella izardii TaxID=82991 RepID=A0A3A5K3J2_9ENTR|nr:hypothetical protein [Buttiauxella izardii]RJT26924.1 hypothetical protein D6029_03820 [Buttiauxella izardii]